MSAVWTNRRPRGRRAGRPGVGVPGLPAAGRLARGGGGDEAGVLRRPALLGPADRRLGRPAAPGADRRPGTGGQRRQPHRPGVHRRLLGRLAVREPAPGRPGGAADQHPRRATGRRCSAPGWWPTVRCAPPDNKPTTAERDTCAPWLEAELDARRAVAAGGRRAGRLRAGTPRCGRPPRSGSPYRRPKPRFGHGAEAAARPGTDRGGRGSCSAATTPASRTPSPAGSPPRCSTTCWAAPRPVTPAGRHTMRCPGAGLVRRPATAPVSQPAEEVALKAIQSGFDPQRGHRRTARTGNSARAARWT